MSLLTYAMKAINPIVNPITTHFSLTAVQIILLQSRSNSQLQSTCGFHSYRPTKKRFQKPLLCTKAALRRSNYQADLKYSPNNSNKTRTRSRNIIWFNPPYSTNVRTNVGRNFLSLVDKHFPSSNPLHKIFNRNSVKVSYSCMNNCKSVISKHNIGILSKSKTATAPTANGNDNCNCRNTDNCPLQKNCLIESVVYKAEVEVGKESSTKEYIGMTSTTFKKRFANHKTSFENPDKRNSTELSKYIWQLNKEKRRFSIKWTILKQTPSYRSGAKTVIFVCRKNCIS